MDAIEKAIDKLVEQGEFEPAPASPVDRAAAKRMKFMNLVGQAATLLRAISGMKGISPTIRKDAEQWVRNYEEASDV